MSKCFYWNFRTLSLIDNLIVTLALSAFANKSSSEIPAAKACCGSKLHIPGTVFISSIKGSSFTMINSLLENPFIF
jgi:hypothetical protein